MQARAPVLEIQHAVPGRARLRPAKLLDAAALTALGERIAAVPGLRRVLTRPATGSLILEFTGPPEPLFEAIGAHGIARVRAPAPPPPIRQVAKLGILRADLAVQARTGQTLDLDTAVALVLLAGAAVQVARGQVAAPATSLLLGAVTMLDRGQKA